MGIYLEMTEKIYRTATAQQTNNIDSSVCVHITKFGIYILFILLLHL